MSPVDRGGRAKAKGGGGRFLREEAVEICCTVQFNAMSLDGDTAVCLKPRYGRGRDEGDIMHEILHRPHQHCAAQADRRVGARKEGNCSTSTM